MQDPRRATPSDLEPRSLYRFTPSDFESARSSWPPAEKKWLDLDVLFMARTRQLQARKDYEGALDALQFALGMARQTREFVPSGFLDIERIEHAALAAFGDWLRNVGPNADLLRKASLILGDHEKNLPDPLDNIKADYFLVRKYPARFFWSWNKASPDPTLFFLKSNAAKSVAFDCPWERARQLRFIAALYQGRLRLAELSPRDWKVLQHEGSRVTFTDLVREMGVGLADGGWSVHQWEPVIWDYGYINSDQVWCRWCHNFPKSLTRIRLLQLFIALELYQLDEGHAAGSLTDLSPRYFSAVPVVPWINEPFRYKLSEDEELEGRFPTIVGEEEFADRKKKLRKGEGVLWTESVANWTVTQELGINRGNYYVIPILKKE